MSTKTFAKKDIQNAVWQDTDENSPLVLEPTATEFAALIQAVFDALKQ